MNLYMVDGRSVCPICSGLVVKYGSLYCCFDCKTLFEYVDEFEYNDKSIQVRVRPKLKEA